MNDLASAISFVLLQIEKLNSDVSVKAETQPFSHEKPPILVLDRKAVADDNDGVCVSNGL